MADPDITIHTIRTIIREELGNLHFDFKFKNGHEIEEKSKDISSQIESIVKKEITDELIPAIKDVIHGLEDRIFLKLSNSISKIKSGE